MQAAAHDLTTQQLPQYNSHVRGTCDQLDPQNLCATPPGDAYVLPPTNGNPEDTVPPGGSPPVPT
ncbi:hypothetical protein SPI_08799 [Niveomyces insectorum RCEF 264]|uniref:Uncharacterized protein n=1 Tax=Niveomyces insectorum RCEF 264 TaxID=1081102 RepID=A0A167MMX8_9HYPO|nr:hypothetical protein SPI_08799 [Niveomyces insectorum RCEF 264]